MSGIESQQLKVAELLRKAFEEDRKQTGAFTKAQNEAWEAYDEALSELGKMIQNKS